METCRPLIVDVRRGSLEDGPGIRSVVFFKGCPLRCIFCHNPEAQETEPEIAFAEEHCLKCGKCAEVCPRGAIELKSSARIDRDKCDRCGRCVSACPGNALRLIGTYWPVECLAELLLRDVPFYIHSAGGVTLSGGECTMFPDYVQSLLQTLKANDVHIVLQTSGYFEYNVFASKILPYLNLIFFDLKVMSSLASITYLGRSNEMILDNLRHLLAEGSVKVCPRIPLIPGITDSRNNLTAVVDFLCQAGAESVSLLPYNPLGMAMYSRLGKPRPGLPQAFTNPAQEKQLIEMFREIVNEKASKPGCDRAAEVACRDNGSPAKSECEPPTSATGIL